MRGHYLTLTKWLCAAFTALPISHVAAQTSSVELCDPDRLLVEVREPATPASQRALLSVPKLRRQSTGGPQLRYELNRGRFRSVEWNTFVRSSKALSDSASASRMAPCETRRNACTQIAASVPEVIGCEPVRAYQIQADTNDPQMKLQWGLRNLPGGFDIRAPSAWQYSRGKDTLIAIIDTGVDYKHSELTPNIWTNVREQQNGKDDDGNGVVDDVRGWDFADGDPDPMDRYGHGTHVAGIATAVGNNNAGLAGAAFESKVLPLKVLADGEAFFREDDVAAAINYATDLALSSGKRTIINLSLGGFGESKALHEAIRAATAAGVVVIAAAGNNNRDTDVTYFTPTSFPEVISVASIGRTGLRSRFSNHGLQTVDVAAPGEDIVSTWPGGLIAWASGTSQAAPFVSATSALVLSRCSNSGNIIKPSYLSYLLKRSAMHLSSDFTQSGLVNALDALQWCSALVAPFDMQGRYQYLLLSNTGTETSYKVWLEASNGSVLPLSSGTIKAKSKKKVSLNLGSDSVIAGGKARLFVATSNPSVTTLLKVAAPLSRAKGSFRPYALRLSPARTQSATLPFSVPKRNSTSYRATLSIVSRGPLPQEYSYEIFKGSRSLGQNNFATGSTANTTPSAPQGMGANVQNTLAEPFTTIELPLDGPGSYRVKLTVRSHDAEPFSASVIIRRVY